jgi:protein-L-isoaspartate(D-aspartate) O-methyltransferase
MVNEQLRARGISDERVLQAFLDVPREVFVDPDMAEYAYADMPLPIGEGQTISQPYVVALMVEALEVQPGEEVLEVGAGSGYAAAILSRLARGVVAIERHPILARGAADRIRRLGYDNVNVRVGDGTRGWPEAAPFHAVLVSAGGPEIPDALVDQLAPGGRMVIPIGGRFGQELLRLTKSADGRIGRESLGPVVFVPLVGGDPAGQASTPSTEEPRTKPRRAGRG